MNNMLKTTLLMAGLMGLLLAIGEMFGGRQGLMLALVFGGLGNLFMYWFSDRIVLMMHGARRLEPGELPHVERIVTELAQIAGMPMPKLYLMETPVPNAFATGRNPENAAVAVTTGILEILDERELRGVLGHELSHVLHRDILISTLASVMAGAIMVLARMAYYAALFGGGRRDDREEGGNPMAALAMMILAPLAASLIQMAISRSREFHADEGGARLCGEPLALAGALAKIERGAAARQGGFAGRPATAHLYIINPFSFEGVMRLFMTHPPTHERVERLEAMAGLPPGGSGLVAPRRRRR